LALEDLTGTKYIDSLTSTNPAAGDSRVDGDDHIRGIKNVLKLSFPGVSGAVTATHTELNYVDVTTLGTGQANKAVTVSAASAINMAGLTWTDLGTVTTVDINGGTADAFVIGGAVPAAGSFTTITGSTSLALATGATVTGIADEDAMGSDSATLLATQQSIKAYVDAATTIETARGKGGTAITSGGGDLHTIAHTLSGAPDVVQVYIKCNSTDSGWSTNDIIFLSASEMNANGGNSGIATYVDATNVYVRVSLNSTPIVTIHKTTGAIVSLDETKWNIYINAIYFG